MHIPSCHLGQPGVFCHAALPWQSCLAVGAVTILCLQLRVNQDEPMEDYPLKVEGGREEDSRRFGMGQTTKDQMRTNVINEIISTERDYIKHLKDICEVRTKGGRDWKSFSEG